MKRLLLSVALVFAFGGMCSGGTVEDEDPVVVPVKGDDDDKGDDDGDDENYCCEYKDAEGATQYALVDGVSDCNDNYSENEPARYIDSNQCIPCCCETEKEEPKKGHHYELTTPKSCNSVGGECMVGDSEECADKQPRKGKDKEDGEETTQPLPKPRTGPRPVITRPGSDGDGKRPR